MITEQHQSALQMKFLDDRVSNHNFYTRVFACLNCMSVHACFSIQTIDLVPTKAVTAGYTKFVVYRWQFMHS